MDTINVLIYQGLFVDLSGSKLYSTTTHNSKDSLGLGWDSGF